MLGRDAIIAQVAALVGPPHVVDLKGYELLVTVEVYQVRLSDGLDARGDD